MRGWLLDLQAHAASATATGQKEESGAQRGGEQWEER